MKKNVIAGLLLSGILAIGSQTSLALASDGGEKSLLRQANLEFSADAFASALPIYQQVLEKNPDNVQANYKAGLCCLDEGSIHKREAAAYLEKAYALDPKVDKEILFLLGRAYQMRGDYDLASEKYEEFISSGHGKNDTQQRAKQLIEDCALAKELKANPLDVNIVPFAPGINTPYHEYSAVLSADERTMVFTSRRPGSTGSEEQDEADDLFEDMYVVTKNDQGKWGTPVNLEEINTDSHDASVGLSPDGQQLLVYLSDEGAGDIFYCDRNEDGTWQRPKPFPKQINNPMSNERHATISRDGNTLYFVSDRSGGLGGFDIYRVSKNPDGKWGGAVNLGAPVNTPGDEDAPFIDIDDQTLYFSSNGHPGMGEFDVFKTKWDEEQSAWAEPKNMGFPINSPSSDIFFVVSGDGKTAYFNSASDGGQGGIDLYMISPMLVDNIEERQRIVSDLTGKPIPEIPDVSLGIIGQVQSVKGDPVADATVHLVDEEGQVVLDLPKTPKGYQAELPEDLSGTFRVVANAQGFLEGSEEVVIEENQLEKGNVSFTIFLKPIEENASIVLHNIYYDFDKATLKKESFAQLDRLANFMETHPGVTAEVGGHCDSRGSEAYNQSLSERRSKAVVEYLVKKGVDSHRLIAKGYGETRPLASNDDEKDGREVNRRTEFTVKKHMIQEEARH